MKLFYLFSSFSVLSPLPPHHLHMPLQCGVGTCISSYTIKRKPLSALSSVLRKHRHHTTSIRVRKSTHKCHFECVIQQARWPRGQGVESITCVDWNLFKCSRGQIKRKIFKLRIFYVFRTWSCFLFTWQNTLQGDARGVYYWVSDVIKSPAFVIKWAQKIFTWIPFAHFFSFDPHGPGMLF